MDPLTLKIVTFLYLSIVEQTISKACFAIESAYHYVDSSGRRLIILVTSTAVDIILKRYLIIVKST
jgi:hypothetical protein